MKERISDAFARPLGTVDHRNGKDILRDIHGRPVGTFDGDKTRDIKGRIVGRGNLLGTLLDD